MTQAEIITAIAAQVTAATADNSITPTIVGNLLTEITERTREYKVYIALLTQSGTAAPVATEIKNTLSGTPVWSRASATDMRATLAGEFIENKTIVFITNGANGAFSAGGQRLDDDTIKLSPPGDNQISNASIEIRVYP